MKVLIAILGLVLVVSHAVLADQELANMLKPYEAFSPYKWTQWIAMRPSKTPTPIAAAAVAYAPQPEAYPYSAPEDSTEDDDDDDEDDDEFDTMERTSAFASWFKRAILPQPPPVPEKKKDKADKKDKATVATTKKPSIVDVEPDFWVPPPSIAPNVTLPVPPGYYAAKKSMFVSKLFASLAASVLNATVAPPTAAPEPTTISPRQAILDEISRMLLTDVARSAPAYPEDTTTEPEEYDDSDEDSDEAPVAPVRKVKPKPTTVNPFLLSQIDFLAKLTEAIAATQTKPTAAPTTTTQKPKPAKPTTTESPKGKKGGKSAKKSSKKLAKTPAYLKWIPTTTTPSPTEAPPAVPEIDYNALAKALLGNAA